MSAHPTAQDRPDAIRMALDSARTSWVRLALGAACSARNKRSQNGPLPRASEEAARPNDGEARGRLPHPKGVSGPSCLLSGLPAYLDARSHGEIGHPVGVRETVDCGFRLPRSEFSQRREGMPVTLIYIGAHDAWTSRCRAVSLKGLRGEEFDAPDDFGKRLLNRTRAVIHKSAAPAFSRCGCPGCGGLVTKD
jgi:hypothetical protein